MTVQVVGPTVAEWSPGGVAFPVERLSEDSPNGRSSVKSVLLWVKWTVIDGLLGGGGYCVRGSVFCHDANL